MVVEDVGRLEATCLGARLKLMLMRAPLGREVVRG